MSLTRRELLRSLSAAVPATCLAQALAPPATAQTPAPPQTAAAPAKKLPPAPKPIPAPEGFGVAPGPFQPTWESLSAYQVPDWYRDAKLGIWAHWGPQCQPEMGDWYAQRHVQARRRRLQVPRHKSTATRRSSASKMSSTSGRPTNGTPKP